MAISRLPVSYSWTVTTAAELASISNANLCHGDRAYVTDDSSWHVYDKTTSVWSEIAIDRTLRGA